ncbi:MAG: sulfatase [Actinomycetota bacterium]
MPRTVRTPNVILINCDDLGYGDLGCYGSEVHDTPAIDRLAAEGTRLTDFYMGSPVCTPSRGAMLTGCYPPRIGFESFGGAHVLFPGHRWGLNPSEVTIARMLKDAGYATQMVGKWHCGDQPEFLPTRHGFDHWYGLPYSNDMGRQATDMPEEIKDLMVEHLGIEFQDGDYPPLPLMLDEGVQEEQPDQAALTERYLQESVRFMRDHRDEAFFLYFAHMYVHLPIYVQPRFLEESRNGSYGAAVRCIDWALDVIVHELDALGLTDDTVVIFTSDNGALARPGEGSNLPLRDNKGTTWEGGQRVPCIVRWPGHVAAGADVSAVATAMDFLPTIATWCGGEVPGDRTIDGRDIGALLGGATDESPHEAFFYFRGPCLEAVRAGRWKLHVAKSSRFGDMEACDALFDLDADIAETTDLHAEHPEVVAALTALIDAARADLGDAWTGTAGADVRPAGEVADAKPLTYWNPQHPYYMAEYDLGDRG